jgi:hypothetical protein
MVVVFPSRNSISDMTSIVAYRSMAPMRLSSVLSRITGTAKQSSNGDQFTGDSLTGTPKYQTKIFYMLPNAVSRRTRWGEILTSIRAVARAGHGAVARRRTPTLSHTGNGEA